jgi:SEC-C motif domain protein
MQRPTGVPSTDVSTCGCADTVRLMARRRSPAPNRRDQCPCGTGDSFAKCCEPLLAGGAASSPARLMRSRYTAFTRGDLDHLRRTWHPSLLPEDLTIDPNVRWLGLTIVDAPDSTDGPDAAGEVEFIARYRHGSETASLQERSRFVRLDGEWVYLDGVFVEPAQPGDRLNLN